MSYSPPADFTLPSPPYYRPATSVTLTCHAHSATGMVTYEWSSTCISCFATGDSSQTISDSILTSYSAGVHTCTANDSVQNTGSNSTQMKLIGRYSYLRYFFMTILCLHVLYSQVLDSISMVLQLPTIVTHPKGAIILHTEYTATLIQHQTM